MWDIESPAELFAIDREGPIARVHCQIWIIPPKEDLPGKWGGRLTIVQDIDVRLADFMFRLTLEDGRQAECFVDLNLSEGTGLIDGSGPPPGQA